MCYNSIIMQEKEMEIISFIEKKEQEELLKSKVRSKQHRNVILKVLEEGKFESKLFDYLVKGYENYNDHKILMKNKDIHFEDFFKDKTESYLKMYENFDDTVQKSIIVSKSTQLKKRIMSKKYDYLCDHETEQLFLEMANLEFTKEELQKFIGVKLAAFNHSMELNGALMNLIKTKKGWSPEKMKAILSDTHSGYKLVKGEDYIIDYDKDNKLVIEFKSFEASSLIGSKMWCISRDQSMFSFYKEDRYTDYKILFDFNKSPADDFSMVAALVDVENNIRAIFSKSDKEFSKEEEYEYHKELLKEVYEEEDLSMGAILNKFCAVRYLKNNPIGNDRFNPYETEHLYQLIDETSDWSRRIMKEDLEKCKDMLFDIDIIDSFPEEGILPIENKETQEIMASSCYDQGDYFKFLDNKGKNSNIIEKMMSFEILKNKAIEMLSTTVKDLLKKKDYSLLMTILNDDDFIKELKDRNDFGCESHDNVLWNLSQNKGFREYYKENNQNIDKLLSILDDQSLKDTGLANAKNLEEIENYSVLLPSVKGYVSNFEHFDYTKMLTIRCLFRRTSELFDLFDFTNEKKDLKKMLLQQLEVTTDSERLYGKKEGMDSFEEINKINKKAVAALGSDYIKKNIEHWEFEGLYRKFVVSQLATNECYTKNKFELLNDMSGSIELKGKIDVYEILRRQLATKHQTFNDNPVSKEGLKIALTHFKNNSDIFDMSELIQEKDNKELNIPEDIKKEFLTLPKKSIKQKI
jgi:hypothetical protein